MGSKVKSDHQQERSVEDCLHKSQKHIIDSYKMMVLALNKHMAFFASHLQGLFQHSANKKAGHRKMTGLSYLQKI